MKKSLIAFAALATIAGAASAQSSVTLFGVVDLSVNSFKNGSRTVKSMDSNQLASNRLGFRGTEDLGGGMKASFWLESGMANDSGNAGAANTGLDFQRRSTVSLEGGFGEIRLGRDYTNTFTNVATFDAYGANGFGNFANLYASGQRRLDTGAAAGVLNATMGSGATTSVRANNMVGYFTPGGLGGFYGSVQIAANEAAPTATAANKYMGFRVGYAAGPLNVAVATSKTDTAFASDFKVTNLGGSFDAGFAKFLAQWDQRKFGTLKYTSYQLSASVPLGNGELRGSYARGNASGGTTNANDATLVGAEYIYNLSKRTALYGQFGQLSNKGASNLSLGGSTTNADITNGGFKSTAYGVGVRHIF